MTRPILAVRFGPIGKLYHFDGSTVPDIRPGEMVIVDTARGRHLGEVVEVRQEAPPVEGELKRVERRATPADLLLRQTWQARQTEALINCRARAAELKLSDLKIVAAEFSFDGARLSILFTTESDEKIDPKALRKDMQRLYPQAQVEMRQIGPRDVAKLLGGMGACGLETRCCARFLTDFSPISIKMAKEQGISLTPSEITGMCGRLRCCLIYEYEQYVEARKTLPKRNKRVVTPDGEGKVVDVLPLRGTVLVLLDGDETGRAREYPREDLQPWDELEALRRKAEAPCEKHGNGGCTCKREKESDS